MNREFLKKKILERYSHLSSTEAHQRFADELGMSIATLYNILRYQMPKEPHLYKMMELLEINDFNLVFKR